MANTPNYSDLSAQEEFDLILPPRWTRSQAPDGNFLYYDPQGSSHNEHPLIYRARTRAVGKSDNLPSGWRDHKATLEDGATEVYYTNSALGLSMWDHPCLREELEKLVRSTEEKTAEVRAEQSQPTTPQQKINVDLSSSLPTRVSGPSSPSVYARGGVQKIQRMTPSKVKSSYFSNLEASARQPTGSPRPSSKQPAQSLGATSPTPQTLPNYSRTPHGNYAPPTPGAASAPSRSPLNSQTVTGSKRFSQAEQTSLHQLRLSKDIYNVNLMNHHRMTEIRKLTKDSFYFQSHNSRTVAPPPPSFDVPPSDPFSQMVKILQRSPRISAATLQQLFASGKYEDSARLSHLITHVMLNPFSTDQSLTTNFLIACIDAEEKYLAQDYVDSGAPEFGIFVRPDQHAGVWDSSMMPLCANNSGTSLTQTLLCHGLRVDVVAYLRGLWGRKLQVFHGSSKTGGSNLTHSWSVKRDLKKRDQTTILSLATKLIDAVTSREAMINVPQTVVEVAHALESRHGKRARDAYILHYFLLPVLPLVLCDMGGDKSVPPEYQEFSSVPECAVGWWDAFTGAVSPRQAQFVPSMTVDQFEQSFECPSWCGIVWVFWRVVQSSFDLSSSSVDPEQPKKTMFGSDIASAASGCTRKLEHYKNNLTSLSWRHHNHAVPVLDPSAFSQRLSLLTPKCLEVVNLLVMSTEELKFMVPTFWQTMEAVVSGTESGNRAAALYLLSCTSSANKTVGRLENGCVYMLHLPVNDASNDPGVVGPAGGEDGHDEDGGVRGLLGGEGEWPKAPVPPPPPPLPTRSHGMLRKKESKGESVDRSNKRGMELQRGMEIALGCKDMLEKLKRKEAIRLTDFDKKVTGGILGFSGGVTRSNAVFSNNRTVGSSGYESTMIVQDVDGRSLRLRNLQSYDDNMTAYERDMKFMGDLRKYDRIERVDRRGLTKGVVGGGEGYLKPRLDPKKLEEISRGLESSSKKQQEDHFYLMGRDENNEPRKILEFDSKMAKMRETGFSPHKKRGSGYVPKTCRGGEGKGRERESIRGKVKRVTSESSMTSEMEERTRKVKERARKVMEEAEEGEDEFENQIDAMLAIVEMGKT